MEQPHLRSHAHPDPSSGVRRRVALLQGTLDLLILRTLANGRDHGRGIARAIRHRSADAFRIDEGSLYPALQRLEGRQCIAATWGVSSRNRRARFYELTKAGHERLAVELDQWQRLADAMARVLGSEPPAG